jgi:prepilin-type processing-associated H-X9-DG protein
MSTWLTDILEEVTFDLVSLTVSVLFADGHTEDWPLMDRACVDLLEDIVDNLRQNVLNPASSLPPAPPSSPVFKKPAKHKKQRSLLMQLVQYTPSILLLVAHRNPLT